jgi:hypothetical protein
MRRKKFKGNKCYEGLSWTPKKKKREPKSLGKNICDLMFGRNMKSAQNA